MDSATADDVSHYALPPEIDTQSSGIDRRSPAAAHLVLAEPLEERTRYTLTIKHLTSGKGRPPEPDPTTAPFTSDVS